MLPSPLIGPLGENMAISEFEVKRCKKAMDKFMAKRRPPAHIRDKFDLGYRIEDQKFLEIVDKDQHGCFFG